MQPKDWFSLMEPKDWITLVIGTLTFISALVNISISNRNRSISEANLELSQKNRDSVHRDQIYRKQIESYEKILGLMSVLNVKTSDATEAVLNEPEKFAAKFHDQVILSDEYKKLKLEFPALSFLLPQEFQRAVQQFFYAMRDAQFGIPEKERHTNIFIHSVRANDALKAAVNQARESLGVTPIGEEVLKITGVNKELT